MARDLLFEIGVEEIPATVVLPALEQLRSLLAQALERERLAHGEVHVYGTPRRLAALVESVADKQEDAVEEIKGPPAKQAFDEQGSPTKAALGFARSKGVDVSDLIVKETDKGEFVFARIHRPGKPAEELLPQILRSAVEQLQFPKTMRWGEGDFRFCRPIRWIVAMLGSEVLDLEIAGVRAGNATSGHRLYGSRHVTLSSPDDYLRVLEENFVIADHNRRRAMIEQCALEVAGSVGGQPRLSDELLWEVTFMVEYPTCLLGSFDERFLELPRAVVIKVLEGHQRFFPVVDGEGRLLPYFVAVRDGTERGIENVRRGCEWVVQPRLEDAEFYMREDLKVPLEQRLEQLKNVTFLGKLGTIYDKTLRLMELVSWLGEACGASAEDIEAARRAAKLSKCDLVTMMIADTKLGELQGVIGAEYARRSGYPESVAAAIAEQYRPRSADDSPPETLPGALLSTADKLDQLVAAYCIGLRPSGSQDPYALRRQMTGLIATAVAASLRYPWREAIQRAYELIQAGGFQVELQPLDKVAAELNDLLAQRLEAMLEAEGVSYDIARAVVSGVWDDLVELWHKALLLEDKKSDAEWEHVVLSGQRITNILRPARDKAAEAVDEGLFGQEEERQLLEAARAARQRIDQARRDGRWEELWAAAVELAPVIDRFFDEVLVMAEDESLRANRLALLAEVEATLHRIANWREVVLGE